MPGCLRRVVDVAGEGGGEVVRAAGGVGDERLAPVVPGDAPRVGEAVGDEDVELLGLRLVAEDARILDAVGTVGGFDLRVVERAFTEVEVAAGAPVEGVHARGASRPSRSRAACELRIVGLVVAVGVLEEHQVRLRADVGAAVAELDAGRHVELVGEDGLLVGFAVAVGVFEDQDLVVDRRSPGRYIGIGRHGRRPTAGPWSRTRTARASAVRGTRPRRRTG